ncbi:SCO6880 family protein [Pilimelia columellifera]|uniref:Type VII secretion protein EccE n=1 Tax=Pilimelia columellifera subsp. columellifera TaxID=706583 RepID=A0ABP6ASV0_9ACTN
MSKSSSREQMRPARTYMGWQRERVAFMLGMSGARFALAAGAVLVALTPLVGSHLRLGFVAWPVAVVMAVLVFIRPGGRTVDEWATAAASYTGTTMRQQNKFISGPFNPRQGRPGKPKPMDLPGILAPVQILTAQMADGQPLAIVHHQIDNTYTAVARLRVPGIGLIDSALRDRRVGGWGALMDTLCTEGNPITRVQALQRLVPESAAALRRWHADHLHPDAPALAAEVTSGLLANSALATSQREAYLAFTMDARRVGRQIKHAGGGTVGAAAVLTRQLRALSSGVAGAELGIEAWLSPRDLAEALRAAFDPDSGNVLSEQRVRTGNGGPLPGLDPGVAGPAAAESSAGSYRHDGGKSVTYWVHEWPRHQVHSTVLEPLLRVGKHRRSLSLHFEPLGPVESSRQVMRERTKRRTQIIARQKLGQVIPEHERLEDQRAQDQDAERANGHGLVRFVGYVTVTVTHPEELEDACAVLEQDAAGAGLVIRRMWFAQDVGFAMSALPLGFGLPKKRW